MEGSLPRAIAEIDDVRASLRDSCGTGGEAALDTDVQQ